MRKTTAPKTIPAVSFESALKWLRRGIAVRRRTWAPGSLIFRVGKNIFVHIPALNRGDPWGGSPQVWKPYPNDILSNDWAKTR